MPQTVSLLTEEEMHTARERWRAWCIERAGPARAERALVAVIDGLSVGLSAEAVAALVMTRLLRDTPADSAILARERWHCEQARWEIGVLQSHGRLPVRTAALLDAGYAARLAELARAGEPLPAAAAEPELEPAPAAAPAPAAPIEAPAEPTAPAPPPPGVSLRELLADHSVVILAALGAFLLVVATVLFELYGTAGLGGAWRLGAVAALALVFAGAGYLALRTERLRTVGHIYVGLAAVLLPLVGVAAWTFLDLHRRGITVDQALAVTGAACAIVYGFLAVRLALRAYADLAAVAILAATWGLGGAAGDEWRPVAVAALPLVYAVCRRAAATDDFADYPWFGHFAFLVAVGFVVFENDPSPRWTLTLTLAAAGGAYLGWQAVAASREAAWIGEGALIVASAAAAQAWGDGGWHFLLPAAAAVPALLMSRLAGRAGPLARYKAHPVHVHLAWLLALGLAIGQGTEFADWAPVAVALWLVALLMALDFGLAPGPVSSHVLRAALPLALAATGEQLRLGPWTALLVAAAGFAYLAPSRLHTASARLLEQNATPFFYGALLVAVVESRSAAIGYGQWALPAALGAWTLVLALAGELRLAVLGGLAGRVLLSMAWLSGIEAAGFRDWRGPLDAVLPLVQTGLGQLRGPAPRAVQEQRRWIVHATALAALVLTVVGPEAGLAWRLAAASGLLAALYAWRSLSARQAETEPLAWLALAAALAGGATAALPAAWAGTGAAAAALALTAAWTGARRQPRLRAAFDTWALPAQLGLAAFGVVRALETANLPNWPLTAAVALAAATCLAWWTERRDAPELADALRSAAAGLASIAFVLAAGTLHLGAPWFGLGVFVVAAAHAAWVARGRHVIESLYAAVALAAATVAIYAWPLGSGGPLEVAELTAVALLWTWVAAERRFPAALALVVLGLAPAVDITVMAIGASPRASYEEAGFAALAAAAGVASLGVRTRLPRPWALALQVPALLVGLAAVAAAYDNDLAVAGSALLAFGAIAYAASHQEHAREYLLGAVAAVLAGLFTLLFTSGADTLAYPAALGLVGVATWLLGLLLSRRLGREDQQVAAHRWLGLGLLVAAALAGFAFPDRTGPGSLGGALALAALEITGVVLWADARWFGLAQNRYLAVLAASAGGCFAARELGLDAWEIVPPGLAVIGCAVRLRREDRFRADATLRQAAVAVGVAMVMGWAAIETVDGSGFWLVVLLLEGVAAVAAGIALHSRVLLVGGAVALALVSVRALVTVAEAGYLFIAFGTVAVVLLAAAAALALGRDRYGPAASGLREEFSRWE